MKNYIQNLKDGWAAKNKVQKAAAVFTAFLALAITLSVFG